MRLKQTAQVWLLGLRIPVLLFLGPRVEQLDDRTCAIRIPLRWRSKNHVGSMYFGALCAGADLAGGLAAAQLIWASHRKVVLLFADVKGEFLKRADGDVVFTCDDGVAIAAAVRQADASGERVTIPVTIVATVPAKYGAEPVARFTLGLSMKRRADKPSPS